MKNRISRIAVRVPFFVRWDGHWKADHDIDRYLYTHVGRWPTGKDPDAFQWKNFSVRNQRFRFVNDTELFDMETDPGQTKNVIEQYPEVVREIRTACDAWWKATRPMMVNETAAMSPTRPFHELYEAQLASGGIPEWTP